jgi:hypothetical protein
MTMMMLGGMMGPIIDDVQVTAAEYSREYPSSTIAGMSIDPKAAVSATAAPVRPAKKTLAIW